MGYRLSKLYTRQGDDGTTGLADGSRLPKDSLRVEAIGAVDELNALLGMLIEELPAEDSLRAPLQRLQHQLFDLGGELSIPGESMMGGALVTELEQQLDALNEPLPPLKNFILPGGSRAAAQCHLARSVCRRAERCLVALAREEKLNDNSRRFLNRLSDYLFVVCRTLARREGAQEILWQPEGRR